MTYYDYDPDIEITAAHVEEALRGIALACGLRDFTSWVMIRRVNTSRLSDHLLLDLKHDPTLPETFDSLDSFRSYLISQSACTVAVQLARPIWKRYQYWLAKGVRS